MSPLVSKNTTHSLVLYWKLETVSPGDHVALYLSKNMVNPVFTSTVAAISGWVDTGVQLNCSAVEHLTYNEKCLGVWGALRSGRDGTGELIPLWRSIYCCKVPAVTL